MKNFIAIGLIVSGIGLIKLGAVLERVWNRAEPKLMRALDDFHEISRQVEPLNQTGSKIAESIKSFSIFRAEEERKRR